MITKKETIICEDCGKETEVFYDFQCGYCIERDNCISYQMDNPCYGSVYSCDCGFTNTL